MHQVASTQMRMQNICVEVLIWIQNSNVLLLLLLLLPHTKEKGLQSQQRETAEDSLQGHIINSSYTHNQCTGYLFTF
jgi:hypothetical protein